MTPKINQTQIINYRRCDNYRREFVQEKKNQTPIWIIGNGTQIIGSIADNGKKQTAPNGRRLQRNLLFEIYFIA